MAIYAVSAYPIPGVESSLPELRPSRAPDSINDCSTLFSLNNCDWGIAPNLFSMVESHRKPKYHAPESEIVDLLFNGVLCQSPFNPEQGTTGNNESIGYDEWL